MSHDHEPSRSAGDLHGVSATPDIDPEREDTLPGGHRIELLDTEPLSVTAVEEIVDALESEPAARARKALCARLVDMGPAVVPVLTRRASGLSWTVLRSLLHVLGEIGDASGSELAIDLLCHDSPRLRIQAIRTLGRTGGRQAIGVLIRIAGGNGRAAQREPFGDLGRRLSPSATLGYQLEAVEALGISGDPLAVPVLEKLSREPGVRGRSGQAVRMRATAALAASRRR